MVAAWMSALIGVGPAIASGSQEWSGNWADLPTTPPSSSSVARVRCSTRPAATASRTSPILNEPAPAPRMKMPNRNGTSPALVMTNALTAAAWAYSSSQYWPMRKYEQMPMTSQPTSSTIRSAEYTTSSIAAVNSETSAAYDEYRPASRM